MFKVLTHNKISVKGLDKFSRDKFEVASEIVHPDAIILRSHQLTPEAIADSVTAIGRAGAGVNNIPVDSCTARGIVVFNTPRANANAVKELVLAGLLLCGRDILGGINYLKQAGGLGEDELHHYVEAGKKQFAGYELTGKTLGVVGLGAIGSLVAEAGLMLGMRVLGLDPALSVAAAWQLPRDVEQIENMQTLLSRSDYVTLHLPVLEATRNLINKALVESFKAGLVLLNFSREELVDTAAIVAALDSGKLRSYVSDFPMPELIGRSDVILMPHLGASTAEAEENCAIMIVDQLIDFLADGNIKNSVNFPNTCLERSGVCRLAISNKNVPKMLGQILSLLADREYNVADMINKSRGEIAYNLIDIESEPQEDLVPLLMAIDGVISARLL
jgi:D-3-phosphoglycerate dehydrogenase